MDTVAQADCQGRRDNLIGSLWMVLAMLCFAIEDSFLKAVAAQMPLAQVLISFGGLGMVCFAGLAGVQGDGLWSAQTRAPAMQIRMVFEVLGRLFFVLALTLVPLSVVTVILQATPVVVVACAALFFGETVGPRRIAAIVVGFVGVLVVLQPGADSFSWQALLAVLGMLGFAGRDLASRAAPRGLSAAVLGFYGYLAIVVAGLGYAFWEQQPFVWPQTDMILALLAATLVGTLAYVALMKAMRTGDIGAVAPFRYSRLLIGIGIGVLWFGEALRPAMVVGSALIVCAGLFLLWRGRAPR